MNEEANEIIEFIEGLFEDFDPPIDTSILSKESNANNIQTIVNSAHKKGFDCGFAEGVESTTSDFIHGRLYYD
jgi:hypothetical protein